MQTASTKAEQPKQSWIADDYARDPSQEIAVIPGSGDWWEPEAISPRRPHGANSANSEMEG